MSRYLRTDTLDGLVNNAGIEVAGPLPRPFDLISSDFSSR